jgi:hypothetical protein
MKLWDFMNIVYPKDDVGFINMVSSVCIFLGILLFIVGKHKKETLISYLKWLLSFIV